MATDTRQAIIRALLEQAGASIGKAHLEALEKTISRGAGL